MNNKRLPNAAKQRPLAAECVKTLAMLIGLVVWAPMMGLVEVAFGQTLPPSDENVCAGGLAVVMAAIVTIGNAGILILLYLYLKRSKQAEADRLTALTEVVRHIGEGDVSMSADETDDRFRNLACAVNDMSTNIQEVLIFLWKQNTQAMNFVSRLEAGLNERQERNSEGGLDIIRQCDELKKSHEDIRKLLGEFRLFGLNMDPDGVWHGET